MRITKTPASATPPTIGNATHHTGSFVAGAVGAGVGLLSGFAVAVGARAGLLSGFAVATGAGVGLLSGFGVAVGAGVAGAASFSKIALISTFPSGMVNLSFSIVTPPLTTCHSLK